MSEIAFSGSVNRENYLRAVRLATGPNREAKVTLGIFGALLFAASVVGPLAAGASIRPWLPFWGIVAVVAVLFFYLRRVGVNQALKTNKLLQEPIAGSAAEDAVRMTTASSTTTLPWQSFYRVKASPDMVLLYQGANLFNMFPREFFQQEEEWQTFRSWALAKVPGKEPRRRRTLWVLLLWMGIFFVVILLYNVFHE